MNDQHKDSSLSYKDAGVDIDAGNRLVERIKHVAKRTSRPEVMGGLGGFGALCAIPGGYREPLLVSATDGVGTKLRLAIELGKHDSVGIDLVAMCVNDLVVCGAEPLFFLDYYATGRLDVDTAASVIEGIGRGCELAGCALIGGETAEMPGMYSGGDYDLAGFSVGVVEKSAVIDGSSVQAGDLLLGLASSGPHSNGYSLIRKIIQLRGANLAQSIDGQSLADILMAPTRIYVKSLLALQQSVEVKALAHITGGGLQENVPRVLPDTCSAVIDTSSWQRPAVFDWLAEQGNVAADEMHRTFNCGIGMILCVAPDQVQTASKLLTDAGETVFEIGEVVARQADQESVLLTGL